MNATHRNHFIPQHYQHGFCCEDYPYQIWSIDKTNNRTFKSGIVNTGTIKDIYSYTHSNNAINAYSVEKFLTEEIENPSNYIINKIRDQQIISTHEKEIMGRYISIMIKRTPKYREDVKNIAPKVASKLNERFESIINNLIKKFPEHKDAIENHRSEGIDFFKTLSEDPPNSIIVCTMNESLSAPICNMNWCFLVFNHGRPIFTSDNPVSFSEHYTIDHPQGELYFPISKRIVLYANNKKDGDLKYKIAGESISRQIHHRVSKFAQRFVYSPVNEEWVRNIVAKPNPQIRKSLYTFRK